ncbi:transketolase-like TK C-terminal-containing protein, partial [Ilumatobacter sp.]|uniref:transketolase-like TK C-terminal-containing protein n=1 Tax=Ilumatobacter sp. TaxID=1967498 RepID=UPI003752320A
DRFDEQDADHKATVFPAGVPVVSVEAGVTFGWSKYADVTVGIDRFGASAPGSLVLNKLGINVDHVVVRATDLVNGTTSEHPRSNA